MISSTNNDIAIKRTWILLLGLIVFSNLLLAQEAEKKVQLHGVVLDGDSLSPLSAAHVVVNWETGTTPDEEGKFYLNIDAQDTIIITHVGYRDYLIPIPSDLKGNRYFVRVLMSRALVELEEVVIYQWLATEEAFKRELLAMEVEPEERIYIPGSFQGVPQQPRTKVSSPISYLYQKFSKAAKQERRFQALKAKLEHRKFLDTKYNSGLVEEVTGITDEKELETFMSFCQLSDSLVERSNQYDIIAAINQCYSDFQDKHD